MEAPNHSNPVAPPASGQHSRPGPVVRAREGAFQAAIPGESSISMNASHVDIAPTSRPTSPITYDIVLSVYYQNAGGINSCVADYYLACSSNVYDVIALTETWLDDRTKSHQIFGPDYDVFRVDRSPLNSRKTTGGGVAIAVHRRWKALKLDNSHWTGVEQVWVSVTLNSRKLYLCAVYIPPDRVRDAALIDEHALSVTSILSTSSPRDDIVILGDFNLPGVRWRSIHGGFLYPDPALSSYPASITCLFDCYSSATLRQISEVQNENGRILDLCFVSHHDLAPTITIAPTPLVKAVPHHPALLLSLAVNDSASSIATPAPLSYLFQRADIDSITAVLWSIDWPHVLDNHDIDRAVQTFTNILGYAIDRHVPKKVVTNNRTPWMTKQIRRIKTQKRAALRRLASAQAHRLSNHIVLPLRDYYLRLNRIYKTESKLSYANHLLRTQQNLKEHPKSFWNYVNEQRKEQGLPSSMFLKDEVANDAVDLCRLFASKFSSTYDPNPVPPAQVSAAVRNIPQYHASLDRIVIDDGSILAAAAKLKSSTSTGPDGIPSLLLKKCVHPLLAPFRHLFNLSLSSGKFPSIWKTAYMFPVHKKGDKANIENYRGISALCAVSKLFELVVLEPIFFHFKRSIKDNQHGYMPGRSTSTNLLTFTSYVTDGFSKGLQTDVVYTDLSAAFDKLSHDIAVAKLERGGICGIILQWFRSYLSGRMNCVKIGESVSLLFESLSGIAQGSHLGPLVYLIYYNDSNQAFDGPCLAFADDLKIYRHITSTEDTMSLQRDLNAFAAWCELNRMVLNANKCSVVSFTRKRNPITFDYRLSNVVLPRENSVKDLGIVLDSKLTFRDHVSYIVSKASRQLGFIFRTTKSFTDIHCLKSLYCSLVRSTLEYCCVVWNPHYQNSSDRIEGVQRRFIRYALRLLPWRDPHRLPSYESRCQLIGLDTLDVRRNTARAMIISDLLTSRIDSPGLLEQIPLLARTRRLRDAAFLWLPIRRTNYSAYGALSGLQRAFNVVAHVFDFNLSRDNIKKNFLACFRLRR